MTDVRIYQPAKTAMQSGRRHTEEWVVEFDPQQPKRPDALMGWIGSAETKQQVRLRFATREDAVIFAESNGLRYSLHEGRPLRVRPKSYAENFRKPT